MTIDSPRTTLPPKKLRLKWAAGDVVNIDGVRWKLLAIWPDGRVVLQQTSNPNAACHWKTTLDRLPEKTR